MLIYIVSTLKKTPATNTNQQNPKQTNTLNLNKWKEKTKDKPTSFLPRKSRKKPLQLEIFLLTGILQEAHIQLNSPITRQSPCSPSWDRSPTRIQQFPQLHVRLQSHTSSETCKRTRFSESFQIFHFYSKFHKREPREMGPCYSNTSLKSFLPFVNDYPSIPCSLNLRSWLTGNNSVVLKWLVLPQRINYVQSTEHI